VEAPRVLSSATLRKYRYPGRLLAVAAFAILCLPSVPCTAGEVAVVLSATVDEYRDAQRGFERTLRHTIVAEYDMDGDFDRGRKIVSEIRSKVKHDLVLAVGVWALEVMVREDPGVPVVYAMVLNPSNVVGVGPGNITGASMNVSAERAVRVLRQLSSEIHRVGIVFDPANTGFLLNPARTIARTQGIQLVARDVQSSGEAVAALDSLQEEGIHALWILPDKTVLAPAVIEHMLLFSYRNRIPVLGLSPRHAEMGALISLSFASGEDIGRQAGELANRILAGSRPSELPYTMARQVALTVNLKAAKKLGMSIPEDLLAIANEVIR
jgi:putative ABC transport system substrate-binding protein